MTMIDNVVSHPHHGLMAEARNEREVVDSAEARALRDAAVKAALAYSEFLEQHGLIWEYGPDDWLRLKASALVITVDYGGSAGDVSVTLKDGALDRVYGNGTNPDPCGLGPPDIPHKQRNDD
jgi:hypothetical protein